MTTPATPAGSETRTEYKYVLTYADDDKFHEAVTSLAVARAVAESPTCWDPPGQPGEVYEREVTTTYGPWRLVRADCTEVQS